MEDQFVNSVDVLLEEIDRFVGKSRKTKWLTRLRSQLMGMLGVP